MSKNTIKTIIMVVAVILCLALAGGWIAQTVVSKQKENEPTAYTAIDETAEGMQLGIAKANSGVKLTSARIATEDYAEYGVSAQSETAYTLNATVTPANAPNKNLTWALSFENPSSAWATGKTPTDYVTVSSSEAQATLSCKKAFGEPILVTATSDANKAKSATCRLNYKQKITAVTFSFGTMTYSPMDGTFHYNKGLKYADCKIYPTFNQSITAEYSVEITRSTNYTVAAEDTGVRFEMQPNNTFIQVLENLGYEHGAPAYTVTANTAMDGTVENFFDAGWAESITGATLTAETKNELINHLGGKCGVYYQLFCYVGDATEPVHTYNIYLDFNDVSSEYDVNSVTFDKSEITF